MQVENTIFISYRHANAPIAQAIRMALMPHGYDIFVDFQSIPSGHFPQYILSQIKARAHFLLLLTPSALERCVNPDDWVRLEIETAMHHQRNIIPLLFEGFDFGQAGHFLTGDLLPRLPEYNGLPVYWAYFDEAMARLRERYLNVDLNVVFHPIPQSDRAASVAVEQTAQNQPAPSEEQMKAQEYLERGIVQHLNRDYFGALENFTKAIEMDESFAEAYFRRGHLYWNLEQPEKALADYRQAAESDPHHPMIHLMRCYVYLDEGKATKALEEANLAVEEQPHDSEAYFARAYAFRQHQKLDEALLDYKKVLELSESAAALNNIGNIYTQKRQYQDAITALTEAIRLNPNDPAIYLNRGNAYQHLQDYDAARADFKQALILAPDNSRALALLEYVESLK